MTNFASGIAGSLGGKAAGGLFGGSGGGGGGIGISGTQTYTPNYSLNTFIGGSNSDQLYSVLKRVNTPESLRREEGISRALGDLASLRGQVRPGFGAVTEGAVTAIRNARDQSIGNLREQLAQRRVAGSSFANDAETRAQLEFAQAEKQARGESTLAEIALSQQLLEQEQGIYRQEIAQQLDELNIARGQSATVLAAVTQAQALNARLSAQESAAAGNFAGGLGQSLTKDITPIFSSAFNGVGTFGGSSGTTANSLFSGLSSSGPSVATSVGSI